MLSRSCILITNSCKLPISWVTVDVCSARSLITCVTATYNLCNCAHFYTPRLFPSSRCLGVSGLNTLSRYRCQKRLGRLQSVGSAPSQVKRYSDAFAAVDHHDTFAEIHSLLLLSIAIHSLQLNIAIDSLSRPTTKNSLRAGQGCTVSDAFVVCTFMVE